MSNSNNMWPNQPCIGFNSDRRKSWTAIEDLTECAKNSHKRFVSFIYLNIFIRADDIGWMSNSAIIVHIKAHVRLFICFVLWIYCDFNIMDIVLVSVFIITYTVYANELAI